MSIDAISGLFATPKNYKPSATSVVQSLVGSLFGAKPSGAVDTVSALSVATQLQVQGESFRRITTNLSKTSSEVQVAEQGIKQIQSELKELKQLAQRASDQTLDAATRQNLSAQFRAASERIDTIVNTTKFADQKLLTGRLSGKGALSLEQQFAGPGVNVSSTAKNKLSINDLSIQELFRSAALNISTPSEAAAADITIDAAIGTVTATLDSVRSFKAQVDYISASFETAAQNQQAAASTLDIPEFTNSGQFSLLNLGQHAQKAIAAQGNALNPALLQLIK